MNKTIGLKIGNTYTLNLYDQCNQCCLFCMVSEVLKRGVNTTQEVIRKEIIIAKESGCKKIDFSGGEPTIYPFFVESVKFANDLGISCVLATNAMKFSSKEYAKYFFSNARIDAIRTSLHHYQFKIHDTITQRIGSYNKTTKGIENILRHLHSKRLCVNIVITSLNYKDLVKIVKFIHKIGVIGVKFSGVSMNGRILNNKWLTINLMLIQKYLYEAIELCNEFGMFFFIEKLPLCIVGNLKLTSNYFIQEITPSSNCIKLKPCCSCRYNKLCTGIEKYLLMLYGLPKFYKSYKNTIYEKNRY